MLSKVKKEENPSIKRTKCNKFDIDQVIREQPFNFKTKGWDDWVMACFNLRQVLF